MASQSQQLRSSVRYRVFLLGPFVLERDGTPLDTTRWQHRIQTLFVLLATAPNRRRLRDEIIDLLWPDASPEAAARNLRLLVHRLRLALGGGEPSAILSEHGWVGLNSAYRWEVDLDCLEEAARGPGDLASLQTAVDLRRGEPLVEHRYEDWAIPVRERAQRIWRELADRLASAYLRDGRFEEAELVAERVLETDPLDEEALRFLLAALAGTGRRGEALRRYRQFEEQLGTELDVRPSSETEALITRLKAPSDSRVESSGATSEFAGDRSERTSQLATEPFEAVSRPASHDQVTERQRALFAPIIILGVTALLAGLGLVILVHYRPTARSSYTGATGSRLGQFRGPRGIAIDAHNTIYVADYGNDRIQEITPGGVPTGVIGSGGRGQLEFGGPIDVAVAPDGSLFATDGVNERIEKIQPGHHARQVDQIGVNGGSLAIDRRGVVYATDYRHFVIRRFSPSGRPLSPLSVRDISIGRFPFPAGITVDGRGMIYLTDRQHDRIVVLSPQGTLLATYGTVGTAKRSRLYHPTDIALDNRGNLFIADAGHDRVVKLSSTGEFVRAWGAYGTRLGQFDQPSGVAVDVHGNIYVSDYFNNRVEKLSPSGTFLWATNGSQPVTQ